jgi:hypothetical protein
MLIWFSQDKIRLLLYPSVSSLDLPSVSHPPSRNAELSTGLPLGRQLQLWNEREVPDTAQSIWFAMNGNIEGLKYLFHQGLASPKHVSHTRRYRLVRVGLKTLFFLNCVP